MGQFLRIGFVAEAMTRLPDGISTDDFVAEIAEEHDWLEKAEKECLADFYPIKYDMHDDFNVSGKMVCFYTNVIQLGSEGKFLMEEYCHTLSFLETCAHRAYSKFRLGKAFRVFVL